LYNSHSLKCVLSQLKAHCKKNIFGWSKYYWKKKVIYIKKVSSGKNCKFHQYLNQASRNESENINSIKLSNNYSTFLILGFPSCTGPWIIIEVHFFLLFSSFIYTVLSLIFVVSFSNLPFCDISSKFWPIKCYHHCALSAKYWICIHMMLAEHLTWLNINCLGDLSKAHSIND